MSEQEKEDLSNTSEKKYVLNDKQMAFLDYYLEDPTNRMLAYMKAFPQAKRTSASVLSGNILKKPEAQAYLQDRQEQLKKVRFKRLLTTHESIRAKMERLCDMAIDAKQISCAIRALELIGKDAGLYTERLRVSGDETNATPIGVSVNAEVDLSALSIDELKAMQQMLKKANKAEKGQEKNP